MTGSDETQPSGDSGRSGSDPRRESIARAAPPPVTEAMITPRTVPLDPEEAAEMEGRVCHACGELNEPGRSVCRSCGARTAAYETESREDPATREMTAPVRPRTDWTFEVEAEEDPGFLWDEEDLWDEERDGRIRAGRRKAPSPKRGARILLILVAAAAILFLGFDVVTNRGEAPPEADPAPAPTAPVAEAPAPEEEDTLESYALRFYADEIADLAGEVEQLRTEGRRINDRWDDRTAGYEATFQDMRALAPQGRDMFLRLREVNRPEAADADRHRRMIEALSAMVRSADGMVTGLQSSDSGETRQRQLADFEAASADFQRLADQVAAAAGSG